MPRVLPFCFQVGLLRGHRLLAAIECMLFRLQPIRQLRRLFAQLLERMFDGRSHFGDFGPRGPTNDLQRRPLDDRVRRAGFEQNAADRPSIRWRQMRAGSNAGHRVGSTYVSS